MYPFLKDTNKLEATIQTAGHWDTVIARCKTLFLTKTRDYGTAWRILRPSSVTDQLYIKALRIRTLEQTGENRVGEGILPEYEALVNYGVMGILQLDLPENMHEQMTEQEVSAHYERVIEETRKLMLDKNHDYGEAWRDMRISSLTDLILMKLLRIKQIEDNQGHTIASEGIAAGYRDIINYAAFALIRLGEEIRGK